MTISRIVIYDVVMLCRQGSSVLRPLTHLHLARRPPEKVYMEIPRVSEQLDALRTTKDYSSVVRHTAGATRLRVMRQQNSKRFEYASLRTCPSCLLIVSHRVGQVQQTSRGIK